MLILQRYDIIYVFRRIYDILKEKSFADVIESRIVAESHSFEDILQDVFFEASYGDDDEIFGDINIFDFVMRSEFRLEGKSVFYLFYGFIAFQRIASDDEYFIIPFPMSSGFQKIPHLIEEEQRDEAYKGAYDDDESRYSEKEDESLSEISDECDGDDPIDPCLGERLEISLDGFM